MALRWPDLDLMARGLFIRLDRGMLSDGRRSMLAAPTTK
jgi:hypothetical protein